MTGSTSETGNKLTSIDSLQLFQLREAVQGDVRASINNLPRILHPGQFTFARMLQLYDFDGNVIQEPKPSSLTMNITTKGSDWHSECEFSQKASEQVTNQFKVAKTTTGENILLLTQRYQQRGKPWVMLTVIETKDADHVTISDPQPRMQTKSWYFNVDLDEIGKLKLHWKTGASSAGEIATVNESLLFDAIRKWQIEKHSSLLAIRLLMSRFKVQSQLETGNLWESPSAFNLNVTGNKVGSDITLQGWLITMMDKGEKVNGKPAYTGLPISFEGKVGPAECLLMRWTDEQGKCKLFVCCPKAIVQLGNKQLKE